MRQNLIAFLEIPLHKDLKYFMFYDVLTISCRYTCETSNPLISKRRDQLRKFVEIDYLGSTQVYMKNKLNRRMREDPQCVVAFNHLFVTKDVDERVELKINMTKAATMVLKKY